jgi:hypothetical protein
MKTTLAIEQWLYTTLTTGLKLPVYNYPPDKESLPNIHISEVLRQPWLIKPIAEKITFSLRIFSQQTSNEEVLTISQQLKKLLSTFKPDNAIKSDLGEIVANREIKFWTAQLEATYYVIDEV